MSTRSALDDPSEIITAGFYFVSQGRLMLLTLDSKWQPQQFSPCCWNTVLLMHVVRHTPSRADSELGVNLVQLHLRALCYKKKMLGSSATWPGVLRRWPSMKKSNEENSFLQISPLCTDSFLCSQTMFLFPVANEHLRIWFSSLEWLPLTTRMLICLNPFSSTYLEVNHLEPAFQRGAG